MQPAWTSRAAAALARARPRAGAQGFHVETARAACASGNRPRPTPVPKARARRARLNFFQPTKRQPQFNAAGDATSHAHDQEAVTGCAVILPSSNGQ